MPGPFFHVRVRIAVRQELRRRKKDSSLAASLTDAAIDSAVVQVKATAAVKAIGDGKIIGRIIDFLQSPLGKALIELLVGLLL